MQEVKTVLDVVCQMEIIPDEVVASSEYNGVTYYFCSDWCKRKFDANPNAFTDSVR